MSAVSQIKQSVIARFIERSGDLPVNLIENSSEEVAEALSKHKPIKLFQRGLMGSIHNAAIRGAVRPGRANPKRIEENYLYASRYFAQAADNGATLFGVGDFRFFQNAVGQNANNDGYPTTFGNLSPLETNMDVGGQIAQGKSFVLRQMGICFNTTAATANIETMVDAGHIVFEKQGGQYALRHGPARLWPGGVGVSGFASGLAAATEASAHNGAADPRAMRNLRVPRVLKEKESFAYNYSIPRLLGAGAVPAVAQALAANTSIVMMVILWGHQVDQIPV
jgi:hypothetical protein